MPEIRAYLRYLRKDVCAKGTLVKYKGQTDFF